MILFSRSCSFLEVNLLTFAVHLASLTLNFSRFLFSIVESEIEVVSKLFNEDNSSFKIFLNAKPALVGRAISVSRTLITFVKYSRSAVISKISALIVRILRLNFSF